MFRINVLLVRFMLLCIKMHVFYHVLLISLMNLMGFVQVVLELTFVPFVDKMIKVQIYALNVHILMFFLERDA